MPIHWARREAEMPRRGFAGGLVCFAGTGSCRRFRFNVLAVSGLFGFGLHATRWPDGVGVALGGFDGVEGCRAGKCYSARHARCSKRFYSN